MIIPFSSIIDQSCKWNFGETIVKIIRNCQNSQTNKQKWTRSIRETHTLQVERNAQRKWNNWQTRRQVLKTLSSNQPSSCIEHEWTNRKKERKEKFTWKPRVHTNTHTGMDLVDDDQVNYINEKTDWLTAPGIFNSDKVVWIRESSNWLCVVGAALTNEDIKSSSLRKTTMDVLLVHWAVCNTWSASYKIGLDQVQIEHRESQWLDDSINRSTLWLTLASLFFLDC